MLKWFSRSLNTFEYTHTQRNTHTHIQLIMAAGLHYNSLSAKPETDKNYQQVSLLDPLSKNAHSEIVW